MGHAQPPEFSTPRSRHALPRGPFPDGLRDPVHRPSRRACQWRPGPPRSGPIQGWGTAHEDEGGLMSAARPSGCRACQPFRPCMPPVPRRAVTAVTGPSLIGSALPPSPCHPRASEPGSPGQGPPFLPPYSPSVLDGLRPHRARGAPGKCESGRCYTGVIGVSSSNSSRPRRS